MKHLPIIIFTALLLAPLPARAESYKPGTIGYLYEQCQSAIKLETAEEFQTSWCAHFGKGYAGGFTGASMAAGFGDRFDPPGTPCSKEIGDEEFKIGQRLFCHKTETGNILPSLPGFLHWATWLKADNPAALQKPLTPFVNEAFRPGPYCDYLNEEYGEGEIPVEGLSSRPVFLDYYTWGPRLDLPSHDDYRACNGQIDATPEAFMSSACGALMTGYLSGLHFAQHALKRIPADRECANEINEVIGEMDLTARFCLNEIEGSQEFAQRIFGGRAYDPVSGKLMPEIDEDTFCVDGH